MKRFITALMTLAALTFFVTASFAGECVNDKDKKCCQSSAAASKDPTAQAVVVDPVCGMDVTAEGCKYTAEYKGKTYRFCSKSCQQNFKKDPAKYINEKAK